VKQTVENIQRRIDDLANDDDANVRGEAQALSRVLEGARRQASFLDEVGFVGRADMPTATLTQDPLYRRMMAIRAEVAE
jgi:hypothetical protein